MTQLRSFPIALKFSDFRHPFIVASYPAARFVRSLACYNAHRSSRWVRCSPIGLSRILANQADRCGTGECPAAARTTRSESATSRHSCPARAPVRLSQRLEKARMSSRSAISTPESRPIVVMPECLSPRAKRVRLRLLSRCRARQHQPQLP